MRVSLTCASDHEEPLEGVAHGGLEWARCPCCQAKWRLEVEGFAGRSGGLIEEWA